MSFWHVFLSDWTFFGQEIFSLDKFWFYVWAQNTLKPLVWHLLHQNILIINDFMKVYEKLIIFIKSLIFNIFWWKKCHTIGLKVFWVDLRIQNLSKINISCQKIFESCWILGSFEWNKHRCTYVHIVEFILVDVDTLLYTWRMRYWIEFTLVYIQSLE